MGSQDERPPDAGSPEDPAAPAQEPRPSGARAPGAAVGSPPQPSGLNLEDADTGEVIFTPAVETGADEVEEPATVEHPDPIEPSTETGDVETSEAHLPWMSGQASASGEASPIQDLRFQAGPKTSEDTTLRTLLSQFGQKPDAPAQPTLVFGQEQQEEPPALALVVLEGSQAGREYELHQEKLILGRGADNDIVFPDVACSRRHAMLEREPDGGYVITDLGSGNGTLINGRRVQKVRLVAGDAIRVGSTVLTFKGAETTPAPVLGVAVEAAAHVIPVKTERRRITLALSRPARVALLGGASLVAFLSLLALIKWLWFPSPPLAPAPEVVQREEEARARQEVSGLLQAATAEVEHKSWDAAEELLQRALQWDPQNAPAKKMLQNARQEREAAAALQEAQLFLERKVWSEAGMALDKVSTRSVYAAEAAALREKLQAALELKRQADEQRAREKKKASETPRGAKVRHPKPRPKTKTDRTAPAAVLAAYKGGNVDQAIAKAQAAGATKLLDKLQAFKSAHQAAVAALDQPGQPRKTVERLGAALELDRQIAGGAGSYHGTLITALGKSYYALGLDAKNAQQLPAAYQAFLQAQKLGFAKAKEGLNDLEREAKKLFENAYVFHTTDPAAAIQKLRVVMQILTPDHIYYDKAKRLKQTIEERTAPGPR